MSQALGDVRVWSADLSIDVGPPEKVVALKRRHYTTEAKVVPRQPCSKGSERTSKGLAHTSGKISLLKSLEEYALSL